MDSMMLSPVCEAEVKRELENIDASKSFGYAKGGEIFSSRVNCTTDVYHKSEFHNWENTCGVA